MPCRLKMLNFRHRNSIKYLCILMMDMNFSIKKKVQIRCCKESKTINHKFGEDIWNKHIPKADISYKAY